MPHNTVHRTMHKKAGFDCRLWEDEEHVEYELPIRETYATLQKIQKQTIQATNHKIKSIILTLSPTYVHQNGQQRRRRQSALSF